MSAMMKLENEDLNEGKTNAMMPYPKSGSCGGFG